MNEDVEYYMSCGVQRMAQLLLDYSEPEVARRAHKAQEEANKAA
jgi:hypothetical protein